MTNPRSAADLLILCLSARRMPSAADSELLAVSRGPSAVWDEVVDLAIHEHVAPLLFKRLKESDARAWIPDDAWKRLSRAFFTSGDRNTRLYRELRTVLQCLRSAGIKVIVLKGAFLAEAVYGDGALRPMCDNDLMVPPADLARAEAVILDAGGVNQKQHSQAAPAPGEGRDDSDSDRGAAKHSPPVFIRDLAIEIHQTIVSPTGPVRAEAAGLWDRARPATIAGVEVLSLSPEDLLLHLCLHFCYQHGCVGLRYLCDIAETLHHYRGEMDWPRVASSAREWGATRYVGLALHLAGSMLGAEVPDEALEQLVPGGVDLRLLKKATECVLTQEPYNGWAVLPFPNRLGGNSTWGKAKALRNAVFLPRDEMALRYPRSRNARYLWPYYVLRLVDLPRRYGRATLQRAVRMMRFHKRESAPSLASWLKSGKL